MTVEEMDEFKQKLLHLETVMIHEADATRG